jgi:hypothetical protein
MLGAAALLLTGAAVVGVLVTTGQVGGGAPPLLPAATLPTASAPAPFTIVLSTSRSTEDTVVYCMGAFAGVYLDAALTKPLLGSQFQCAASASGSGPPTSPYGPCNGGVDRNPMAFGFYASNRTLTLYGHPTALSMASGNTCWAQAIADALRLGASNSISVAPFKQTQIEFTFQASGAGATAAGDLTYVEGVSHGGRFAYAPAGAAVGFDLTCAPPAPAAGVPALTPVNNGRGLYTIPAAKVSARACERASAVIDGAGASKAGRE